MLSFPLHKHVLLSNLIHTAICPPNLADLMLVYWYRENEDLSYREHALFCFFNASIVFLKNCGGKSLQGIIKLAYRLSNAYALIYLIIYLFICQNKGYPFYT